MLETAPYGSSSSAGQRRDPRSLPPCGQGQLPFRAVMFWLAGAATRRASRSPLFGLKKIDSAPRDRSDFLREVSVASWLGLARGLQALLALKMTNWIAAYRLRQARADRGDLLRPCTSSCAHAPNPVIVDGAKREIDE